MPRFADNCFLHVPGLNEMLEGLLASLKSRVLEDDADGAQELHALLRARVQGMTARAELGGASVGDKNRCVVMHACVYACLCLDVINVRREQSCTGCAFESLHVLEPDAA